MPKHIFVARNANGHIVTYGTGFSAKIAEYECRENVRKDYPQDRTTKHRIVATYEPFTMPKPAFRKGQKVCRRGSTATERIVALPGPTDVYLAGTVCVRLNGFLGCRVWESEKAFEAI